MKQGVRCLGVLDVLARENIFTPHKILPRSHLIISSPLLEHRGSLLDYLVRVTYLIPVEEIIK